MTVRRGYGVIPRVDGAYEGIVKISGFPYVLRVTREGDGIAITVTDAPIDAEAEADSQAWFDGYLDRATKLRSG